MDRSAVRQCGANAICAVANHVATCQCETGFYPNTTPEEGCVECTEVSHCTNGQTCHYKKCSTSCSQDSDCADSESCKTGQCENVTCDQLSCGSNAQCVIANHASTCQCNSGYHTTTTADDGCCKLKSFYSLQFSSILIHIRNFQLDVPKTPIVSMAKHVQTTAAHVARTLIVNLRNHARMANAKR